MTENRYRLRYVLFDDVDSRRRLIGYQFGFVDHADWQPRKNPVNDWLPVVRDGAVVPAGAASGDEG